MIKQIQISFLPDEAFREDLYLPALRRELKLKSQQFLDFELQKRSIDARARQVKYELIFQCYIDENLPEKVEFQLPEQNIGLSPEIHIAGAGPAGYFAAIKLIELGFKPVILERGKPVKERRRDLANLSKNHIVNPESNYCFGEGGAGTYSDGKLYTRSDKRGDVKRILNIFQFFGADADISINARPHIGTNKLPGIIEKMREYILACGGDIRFNSRLDDIIIQQSKIQAIIINNDEKIDCKKLILATGHSADSVYEMLLKRGVKLEAKPFALGIRAEHSQEFVDSSRYKMRERGEHLPPAYYNLVTQVAGKGVYSFCMCPGGIIAPCSTETGSVVTNGWSPSKRNNPYANSGIVTEISLDDLAAFSSPINDPLVGLKFRRRIEELACSSGGGTQTAPAQRLLDMVENINSQTLPQCSYTPGTASIKMSEVLPVFVFERLRKAFIDFDQKMKGWLTNDAIALAVESRTSSAVRIPRNRETFEHVEIEGLYPCAEGAGYAGGIVSAAIDGEKCAEKAAENFKK